MDVGARSSSSCAFVSTRRWKWGSSTDAGSLPCFPRSVKYRPVMSAALAAHAVRTHTCAALAGAARRWKKRTTGYMSRHAGFHRGHSDPVAVQLAGKGDRPRQKQELRPPMGPDAHVAVAAFQVLQQIAAHLASQPGGPEARLPAGHAVDRYSPALILLWTITESRRLRASAIS